MVAEKRASPARIPRGLRQALGIGPIAFVLGSVVLVRTSSPHFPALEIVALLCLWSAILVGVVSVTLPHSWVSAALTFTRWRKVALVLVVAFLAVEVAMAWQGHRVFWRQAADQDVWLYIDVFQRTLRGQFLYWYAWHTLEPELYLGHHWALQLPLFVPLWALWPDPRSLYLLQIAAYAATAVLVYRIAEQRLGQGPWPLLILTGMLLAPSKDWSLFRHFYMAPFLPLLIALAVSFLHARRQGAFVLLSAMILMSRDDAIFVVLPLTLYAALVARWRTLALMLGVGALAWTAFLFQVIMPWLAPETAGVFQLGGYRWLGATLGEMMWTVVTQPAVVLRHLWGARLAGLLLTLTPFGVLPLWGGAAIVLLAAFTHVLLHGSYAQGLEAQHSYPAITLAALVAIEGARRLGLVDRELLSRPRLACLLSVPLFALMLHVAYGYSPLSRHFAWADFRATPHTRASLATVDKIPLDVRVTASRHLLNHLIPGRLHTCAWESVQVRPDTPPANLWCPDWKGPLDSEYILFAEPQDSPQMRQLLASDAYGVISSRNDVVLLQRGAPTARNAELARRVFHTRQARILPRHVGEVVFDDLAVSGFAVKAPRGVAGLALYGWYRRLCPGLHQVTLRTRATPGADDLGRLEVVSEAGTIVLAARALRGRDFQEDRYETVRLPFVISEKREIEVRVQTTGLTDLWLDAVSLEPLDTWPRPLVPPDDPPCYSALSRKIRPRGEPLTKSPEVHDQIGLPGVRRPDASYAAY